MPGPFIRDMILERACPFPTRMLDIQFVRENPEVVQQAIERKRAKGVSVEVVLSADRRRVAAQQKIETLKAERNRLSARIAAANAEEKQSILDEGKKIKEQLDALEPEARESDEAFQALLLLLPNVPSEDTPVGEDESGNVVVRQSGEKPTFDFAPKEHWEIAADLDLLDSDRAVKVSGARFNYLKGDLVLLEFALMQFAFSVLTDAEKIAEIAREAGLGSISTKPFVPVLPPMMIRQEMHRKMARLDPEEMYLLERDGLSLIGSAEHTLGSMYADEILEEAVLPIRLVGFSAAFRREAGSYGKDMKGMLRVHQFNKLEMETFSTSETSQDEQHLNVAIQEYFMHSLGLPYQVVSICTGDMGKPDVRQVDIEVWMPGQNKYRETHTSDLIGDFQARRLNTRTRRADGRLEYTHMNDATAFSERPLIAILENFQQQDGSVIVPEVLRKWMGKDKMVAER